jgi:hypothetical protein
MAPAVRIRSIPQTAATDKATRIKAPAIEIIKRFVT